MNHLSADSLNETHSFIEFQIIVNRQLAFWWSHDMSAYVEEYKNEECTNFNGYMLWNIHEAANVNFINSYSKWARGILFFSKIRQGPCISNLISGLGSFSVPADIVYVRFDTTKEQCVANMTWQVGVTFLFRWIFFNPISIDHVIDNSYCNHLSIIKSTVIFHSQCISNNEDPEVGEYGQETTQLHNADVPIAPWGRATEH